jgi:hypothetical protein
MTLSAVVSFVSIVYLASLPIIAVFANIYPHMMREPENQVVQRNIYFHSYSPNLIVKKDKVNCTEKDDWDEGLMVGVVVNQFLIFIIGENLYLQPKLYL